ncbi:cation:proton antiporter [Alkalisalibacterium limincola]|uniref:Cation:proton antiporter n=1 Tax=Alkalisalibacterium limincola TaxID=2699169 RepID=A0A5C8KNN5_9GAMM|nr:cation:proton antiporter [Alkalisalibacterium limincola]TXK61064.1 cation:proton antiporter [Alkalisalibacterium limincola]
MPIEFPITDPLLQFAVLISAVLLVQVALERVFVPGLLGLLLLGMLLGPGGAEVLPREPVVELLGQIGLIYIMFMAGLEIDLSVVRKHLGETLGFGSLAFLTSLLLGAGVGFALGFEWPSALLLGTLLSSHTLVSYPILKRLQLLGRRPVVAALGGTVLTDTLALVLLAILLQLGGGGDDGRPDQWWMPLLLLTALAALSLTGLPKLARAVFRREWVTPAEKALFALFALLALASTAELIGTEKILGAFLAGLCLNRVLAENEDTRQHVEFVGRMLFVPIFFVSTGMLLELEVVFGEARVWGIAALLCGVVVVGKAIAAWVIGARYGFSRNGRLMMLVLTMPQAAATLAITVAGQQVGLLEAEVVDAVIIVILLTCSAGPLLTRWIGDRMRARAAPDDGPVNTPTA